MSRRIVLSHVSVLLTAIAIPVLLPGCSRPSENPASTIKTMRFDPDESTVYQKAFPLSVDHLEELFKPPFLVDRTMSLWHVTAMVADDTTYFEKTLDSGSAIRERDANNNTLLHYSALNPNVEMTRFLLIPLANSYAKNDNDETPLDWAVTRNPNVEVVRLLYDTESGTDV